jgi:hypothetical protein
MTGPLVVVAGAMANKPNNGGEAWVRMSWVRGLARLGCQVAFVEEIAPETCVDRTGGTSPVSPSVNRRWFDEVMNQFELTGASALCCDGRVVSGMGQADLDDMLHEADLLVNVSGNLETPRFRDSCRLRAYIDIDPGFTQMWTARGNRGARLDGHHRYFTIGTNIGHPECPIPSHGIAWRTMFPPVVLEDWPVLPVDIASEANEGLHQSVDGPLRFTTIATWRGPYGPIEWERRRFGLKVHEFRKFVSLPTLVEADFEAALAIHPDETADLELLADHGWHIVDPARVAGTPMSFRDYVGGSAAEFSVAQEMYVATSSGWFSDRSTRYLASGRPVLVQDTGFSRTLPVGKGLLAFGTMQDAVAGAESIRADHTSHAVAARQMAEEYFDSDRVLSRFLEECGLP